MSSPSPASSEGGLPQAYSSAYTTGTSSPSARGLAIGVYAVACVYGVLMITNNLSAGPAIVELAEAERTGGYDDTFAQVYYGTAVALAPGILLAWVLTCIWLGQARSHAQAVNPTYRHQRRSGWVWAGWVVPLVNLAFPFQIVRDLYRSVSRFVVPAVFGWWWTLWIVMFLANRLLDAQVSGQIESGELDSGYARVLGVIAAAATLGALVAWGLTMRHVFLALDRADRAPA